MVLPLWVAWVLVWLWTSVAIKATMTSGTSCGWWVTSNEKVSTGTKSLIDFMPCIPGGWTQPGPWPISPANCGISINWWRASDSDSGDAQSNSESVSSSKELALGRVFSGPRNTVVGKFCSYKLECSTKVANRHGPHTGKFWWLWLGLGVATSRYYQFLLGLGYRLVAGPGYYWVSSNVSAP